MSLLLERRLRKGVESLNASRGRQIPLAAIERIVRRHEKPDLLARILSRVLEFEADPRRYGSPRSVREQQKYNRKCDYSASLLVSEALSLFFDRYVLAGAAGYDERLVRDKAGQLSKEGYFTDRTLVGAADCEEIVDFLSREEVLFRENVGGRVHRGYTPANVAATTSNICRMTDQSALLACPAVGKLVFDPNLLAITQDFLGAPPIHTQTNAWWSVGYSDRLEHVKAAAQRFHQDRDYIKVLKIFVYLTDVGDDNGPHQFVAGSNVDYAARSGNELRSSRRLSDEFLASRYPPDRFRVFTGPRGTVIGEDTSGFHKGALPRKGHRLVLQIEYVSSLYARPKAYLSQRARLHAEPLAMGFERLLSAYDAP
jgi:hypothetical protein